MSQYDKDKPPFDVPAQSQQSGAGRAILEVLARIEAKLDRVLAGGGGQAPAGVASDADLDSEWGDEKVKKNPKKWMGDDFAGKKMSECSPEFLDSLAGHFDYKSEREMEDSIAAEDATIKADKKKYAGYSRKSAARARGWAARLRAAWRPPAATPETPPQDPPVGDW